MVPFGLGTGKLGEPHAESHDCFRIPSISILATSCFICGSWDLGTGIRPVVHWFKAWHQALCPTEVLADCPKFALE